jgi:phage terminase large subunit-like protein
VTSQNRPTHSTNSNAGASNASAGEVLGSITPRLWTPPLVDELTPHTSYGFDVIDFARDVAGTPLDPWEEWTVIHAGELLADGRPRFRFVLIIVARQNGKTMLARVLIMYWLFVEKLPLILGTSTDRSYAKRTWKDVCAAIKANPYLAKRIGADAVRLTIGEEAINTLAGCEYTFAANNSRAGRSTTLHRWVCDELREHRTRDAWNAATNAMNAVPGAQVVAITNQGDDTAIVLDGLRDSAIEYIETGVGDPRLGLIEYSAPAGSDPADLRALALANPNLGRRIDPDALLGAAIRAKRAGGIELADFRTEVMCMRVPHFDAAVDPDAWLAAGTDTPLDLAQHRQHVALCLDVSMAGDHATLTAAAVVDGHTHVEVVAAWDGYGCTKAVRAELPAIVARVKPRVFGWFPAGPAAVLTADLMERRRGGWPPRRVKLAEIRTDVPAVCMGLAEQTLSGSVSHGNDPMLNAHIAAAAKLRRGDAWVFGRRGAGPVDGAYAAAGAVHLARTLPPLPPPLSVA